MRPLSYVIVEVPTLITILFALVITLLLLFDSSVMAMRLRPDHFFDFQ